MKKIFIILLIICNYKAMSQDFKVLPKNELKAMISANTLKSYEQRKDNSAFIYILFNNEVILMPCIGLKGILFESYKDYELILKDGWIPITNEDDFFESNQHLAKLIPNAVDSILSELSSELKVKIQTGILSKDNIINVERAIQSYGYKKAYNNLYFALGVYVGELIRQQIKGQWMLKSEIGINRYLEPSLQVGIRIYNPWMDLSEYLTSRYRENLKTVVQNAIEKITQ